MSPDPATGQPARPADTARAARPEHDADGEPTAGGGSRRRRTPADRGRQAFARHLDDGMTRGGWTLRGLARQLTAAGTPVSPATLSAWRRGAAAPDHPAGSAALGMAEITLGIPAGDLPLRLALPDQPLHPIPPVIAYTGRTHTAASAAGVAGSPLHAAAADRIGRQPLTLTALAWHHHVGADGRLAYSQAAVAVRALDEFVGGYWLLHHHTGTSPPPAWAAGRGARILAVHSDRSGLAAAEIAFPRWLAPGDHHVFTLAVHHTHPTAEPTDGSADAFRYVACALPLPVPHGSLRLTFHTPPRRVEQTRWDLHPHLDPATPTHREQADPDPAGSVFRRLDGATPAAYGWRWH